MNRREFLMLAHKYNPSKHGIGGWFLSEKLDGQRCFWDGGISRGIPKRDIPWANHSKDGRYITPPISTGLWSRYGNVIHAPDWFLDQLPRIPLDGELWLSRGKDQHQALRSIISRLEPGDEWSGVKFHVFDSPPFDSVFMPGRLTAPNFTKVFKFDWDYQGLVWEAKKTTTFETVYKVLQRRIESDVVIVHPQIQLNFATAKAEKQVMEALEEVTAQGGEGLMLRNPDSLWTPQRSHNLVKVKKLHDDEARVIGYTSGRLTDKGSKLLGLMGALIVEWRGRRFELSGFTDQERDFGDPKARQWAEDNPGEEVPSWVNHITFPRDSIITFAYRDLSRDGIPQEARFLRKYHDQAVSNSR